VPLKASKKSSSKSLAGLSGGNKCSLKYQKSGAKSQNLRPLSRFLMIRCLYLCFSLALVPIFGATAQAAEAPSATVATGELGLEGQVQKIDNASGQITILATAFSTSTGRKEIAPPKLKTLITTGKTRFFDERARRDFGFGAIALGLSLRVVGRDAGTGKPLDARVVLWSSLGPNEPADPETPEAIEGLLPPSQAASGVRVRIYDAGFAAPQKLFPNSDETAPIFFVAFRTFAPAEAKTKKPAAEWARFTGLTTPDGQLVYGSGGGILEKENGSGSALSFPNIDPRWKSVTANWEITSPQAPAGADGQFSGGYELKGATPSAGKPLVEPKTTLKTAHGTKYVLQSIACDFEKKTTTFTLSIEKPANVPGVRVSTYQSTIKDDLGTLFRSSSRSDGKQFTVIANGLPAPGAKSLTIGLEVEESAPGWKKQQFYRPISLDIPVAALANANPPSLTTEDVISYNAENDVFTARLEETRRSDEKWWGALWVKPQNKADTIQTLVQNVPEITGGKAVTADGRSFDITVSEASDVFFHSDRSAPVSEELATALQVNITDDVPIEPVRLELETTQTRQLLHSVDLPAVPIPALEGPLTFDTPQGQGTLRLQKVAFVQGKSGEDLELRTDGSARVAAQGALVMVFTVDRALPEETLRLKSLRLDNQTIGGQSPLNSSWNGDGLSEAKNNSLWTLVVQPPTTGAKTLKVHLDLLESGPTEPAPPIVIEKVDITPASAKE
jgi:hypothetical protein